MLVGDDSPSTADRVWALSLISQQRKPGGAQGIAEWLTALCRAVTVELKVCGAAVTLSPADGSESVVAASDPVSHRMAELEFGVGEGPARDARLRGKPVLVPQLGIMEDGAWPGYTAVARESGICAVFAFPLQVGAARFGALTVFGDAPISMDLPDLAKCLAMSELATERLLDTSVATIDGAIDPDLDRALGLRGEIYQAQGMVMVALDITLAQALARMRAHAFQAGRDLLDVAVDIVGGRLELTDDRADP